MIQKWQQGLSLMTCITPQSTYVSHPRTNITAAINRRLSEQQTYHFSIHCPSVLITPRIGWGRLQLVVHALPATFLPNKVRRSSEVPYLGFPRDMGEHSIASSARRLRSGPPPSSSEYF